MLHKPVRRYEQGHDPGPDDKIKLIYDKKGRSALQSHAALEEGSHDITQHRSQGEAQENGQLLIAAAERGQADEGRYLVLQQPDQNPADRSREGPSKGLAVTKQAPTVREKPTAIQRHTSSEEYGTVIRYVCGQHQPESNYQGIHPYFLDRFRVLSHISKYLMDFELTDSDRNS